MPFELGDEKVNEEIRLKYRYLELRTQKSYISLKLRLKKLQWATKKTP